ncbi:hypothetical protein LSTR_LSTR012212 [Laodelphax striatellus]|uniref:tRNA-dihydrouridine(20a/20b) synthase [NAD(P)+] n=1 Tax=Laodelphax striatellus TaxID=195883 RepID=A0A482XPZ5_LAOST|nr:hypothetical protein LSTR_LSTR012212 [Laodelphax striatellus]
MVGRQEIVSLFDDKPLVHVAAPMVRYSKLQFRTLVRKYGCDLCFSPMIVADSFVKSIKARDVEFTTNEGDSPLSVQFAANNANDFVEAAELVAPFCDGVDLNCGCPQRWAMKEGFGADLLSKPHIIHDIVRQLRNRLPQPFAMSVKMRILSDIRKTVDLCRSVEATGVSFLTVHGRTPKQRCEPVDLDALTQIQQATSCPIVANGDVRSLNDAVALHQATGCKGIMSARGLLQNPALFQGHSRTPLACVQDWIKLCLESEASFQCFHHHLVFMLEKVLPKHERHAFNVLRSMPEVLDFISQYFDISIPERSRIENFSSNIIYKDTAVRDGTYFSSKLMESNDKFEDYLDSCNLFDE